MIRGIAAGIALFFLLVSALPSEAQRNFSSRRAPDAGGSPPVGGFGGLHSGRTGGTGGLSRGRVAGTGGIRGPRTDRVDDLAGPGDVTGDRRPVDRRPVR